MEKKQMGLIRHATAMHLMVSFPGDRVVPRQRSGPSSQFFMSAASEQCLETFITDREVVQDLEHIKQDRDGYGVQHQGLE